MNAAMEHVGALLRLEQAVRSAESTVEVSFLAVNETRSLAPYTQAVLLLGREAGRLRVSRLSNLSEVDRTAPFVTWVEELARHEERQPGALEPHVLVSATLPGVLAQEGADLAPPHLLWLPLVAAWRGRQGVLLLGRETAWQPHEISLLQHLAGGYAASLAALAPRLRVHWRIPFAKWLVAALVAAAVASLFLPVRLSVLAPAEVSPHEAFTITAPLDGVVSAVRVTPNQPVERGTVLADLETTDLQGSQDVARRALRVAEAELHRASQASFLDPRSKAELAQLQAQVDLKRNELQYAQTRLGNASLKADRAGVAIVDDPKAWSGRPVRVGEAILRIADPARVEITVLVPVKDAIALEAGREVRLFLDTAPLDPVQAQVAHSSYEPVAGPGGTPSYRVTATLQDGVTAPRIGLRGTAKIYGQDVSLFYLLFRRPVTAARQWLGW